ncbi:ABC transporter ATP-binding protein [Tissierella sp. MSJ-40]|uniref:ABC transporter ATP-binding protein n=1 Tax=Tissierella simiarum TaxID=2841534 RepID=A0ABS6E6D9_9FIRM|nr:ABC transporter ATP-binding protein [Tissierella simiarum]MBU5437798.1 ABC transporter ATP-binding protein [Tissierella simiarum]
MIKVTNLEKSLGGSKILNNINLNIEKGSIYGLIGPNGAGKTTLIKTLVGIYEPEAGKVMINGESIKENTKIKSRIGYVSDFQYFYPNFTVSEMAWFYRNTYPMWNEEKYNSLKNIFKLPNKKIKRLSKGMKTQLSLLLNLSISPEVLILDEPTSGLDPVIRRKVLNLIVDEVSINNTTVLTSTHNLLELEQICDHIGIMYNGEILLEENIDEIKSKVRKIQVVFNGTIPEEIKNHKDVLHIDYKGKVYQFVVNDNLDEFIEETKKYNPILLEMIDMSLEEIFIYKMGGVGYAFEDITL